MNISCFDWRTCEKLRNACEILFSMLMPVFLSKTYVLFSALMPWFWEQNWKQFPFHSVPLQYLLSLFSLETWKCMEAVVQEANRILWHWKTFPIILPPPIESRIEPQHGKIKTSHHCILIRETFKTELWILLLLVPLIVIQIKVEF